MKFNFNAIANAISVASGVTLAGIIGVGTYVYVNKDAIIEDIKKDAIESITGGSAIGGARPWEGVVRGAPLECEVEAVGVGGAPRLRGFCSAQPWWWRSRAMLKRYQQSKLELSCLC